MKINLREGDIYESKSSVLLFLSEEQIKNLDSKLVDLLDSSIHAGNFKGKKHESLVVPVVGRSFDRIVIVGLGKREELNNEIFRRSANVGLQVFSKLKVKEFSTFAEYDVDIVRALSDGFRLSNYSFDKYKTEKANKFLRIQKIDMYVHEVKDDFKKAIDFSEVTCDATNFVRDLQTDDADVVNPEYLADLAKSMSTKYRLHLELLDRAALKRKGLGLLLGVGQGSRFEPHLIILEYKGDPSSKEKIAIVGKGVTYDTGGLDIKLRSMKEMNTDMSGAAVVLGVIRAAAELKLKKNILAVAPVVENAVGTKSYKPGTILDSYLGKTVEIGNTDAEGRLALADAMAYVVKNYKPDRIVDFATLTGAVVAALGEDYAGLFSTDKVADKIIEAGDYVGEKVWRMPLPEDYNELLKSKIADLNNISSSNYGGAITAALFLKNFVGKTPWTHIDIAGTARGSKRKHYWPEYGTGFGVRLMLEWLRKN